MISSKCIYPAISVLILSATILCQDRAITAKEFWAKQSVPIEKLPHGTCRMVSLAEMFHESDGTKYASTSMTTYIIYPNKLHTIITSVSKGGTTVDELTWINSWRYERRDGGNWTRHRAPVQLPGKTRFPIDTRDPKHKSTYKFIGQSATDGERLNLYEMTTLNQFGKGQDVWTSTFVMRQWVDDNGFPVKGVIESTNAKSFVTMRTTTYYDYESVVSIEEPKMPVKSRKVVGNKRRN